MTKHTARTTFELPRHTEKPGYTVRTAGPEPFESSPTSAAANAAIRRQRLNTLRNFWETMRNIDLMSDMRHNRVPDVLSGSKMANDLSLPGLLLNNVPTSGPDPQSMIPARAKKLSSTNEHYRVAIQCCRCLWHEERFINKVSCFFRGSSVAR